MEAITTLGEAHGAGWKLRLYCRGGAGQAMKRHRSCITQADVDLATMLWTHGRMYPLARFAGRLKCPGCNSRLVEIWWRRPNEPTAVYGSPPTPLMRANGYGG